MYWACRSHTGLCTALIGICTPLFWMRWSLSTNQRARELSIKVTQAVGGARAELYRQRVTIGHWGYSRLSSFIVCNGSHFRKTDIQMYTQKHYTFLTPYQNTNLKRDIILKKMTIRYTNYLCIRNKMEIIQIEMINAAWNRMSELQKWLQGAMVFNYPDTVRGMNGSNLWWRHARKFAGAWPRQRNL